MNNKNHNYTNVFRYKLSLKYGNTDGRVKLSSEDLGLLYRSDDRKKTVFKLFDTVLSNKHCHIVFDENRVNIDNFYLIQNELKLDKTLRTPYLKSDRYFAEQHGYTITNALCDLERGIVRLEFVIDTDFVRREYLQLKIKIKELFDFNELD